MGQIVIRGAREHNLKGIDVDIPREQLVIITGPSGSGKSSLAFDTIYAEGQRRYVESLSAYARQFLERMDRPDVDLVEGLSPAISIEQKGMGKNPRSTVGTVTEIYDYLRVLYARIGQPHCPECGAAIAAQSVDQMVEQVLQLGERTRLSILAPIVRAKKGQFLAELERLRRDGFARVNIDGTVHDLHETIELDKRKRHDIDVYIDRLVIKEGVRSRLAESMELGLKLGDGLVKVAVVDPPPDGIDLVFSERFACRTCEISFPRLEPNLFSFNNPNGACPRCDGLGSLMEFDETLVVPDPGRSLREGAIEAWDNRSSNYHVQLIDALAQHYGFDPFVPYRELPQAVRRMLMHGSGEETIVFQIGRPGHTQTVRRPFEGVLALLERRLQDQQRRRREERNAGVQAFDTMAEEFQRYMRRSPCPECQGARLRREALAVRVADRTIVEACALPIEDALAFFDDVKLTGNTEAVGGPLLAQIVGRLRFLVGVGLTYLTLDRAAGTLSGGEGQRVRLATQIGASLVGVLYILDEPSIGLHPRDNERLLKTLQRLRDLGNTVIVVEHDAETIRAADHVIDLGPGAGSDGGCVVAQGSVCEIEADAASLTGQFLSGRRSISVPTNRRKAQARIALQGVHHHNLSGVNLELPLGALVCVTGVSGSGKSSLVIDTLIPALRSSSSAGRRSGTSLRGTPAGAYTKLEGAGRVEKVVAVDQSPIGRTPRSNPATYAGLFSPIRELFAGLPESRVRGYKAGRFSFNVKGGRCEICRGEGLIRIEMHFLADVHVPCETCRGSRYNAETLRIRYRGLSIADVLALRVEQACEFFANVPRVRDKLQTLVDVGLGYLTLGQSATTLSGGEAQRLKLSRELSRRSTGHTFYVLDEPTTGLHFADIEVLVAVLNRLVDAGNTVVVIEHNLDVIKSADHVVDLGPEGGSGGGEIVAEGSPEQIAQCVHSYTGFFLAKVLAS